MIDLSTTYLGLALAHPFVVGASPFTESLDGALRVADAGAAALVMHSLFEEDVLRHDAIPDHYLELVHRIKTRAGVPVVASLNGTTAEGWLQYARMIEQAGADALELNFYHVATDLQETGHAVERRVVDIVAVLKESIAIPLAVKLSPFYSALPHLAGQLDRIGANGLVLFNRFYQPDIDPEASEPSPRLTLSDSSELPLRLRWIAILHGRIKASLAVSGGVHTGGDAAKAVLAGADAVQIVSALLRHGPGRLQQIREAFIRWGERHHYGSVDEIRGRVSLTRTDDPARFERGNYIRVLHSHGGVS